MTVISEQRHWQMGTIYTQKTRRTNGFGNINFCLKQKKKEGEQVAPHMRPGCELSGVSVSLVTWERSQVTHLQNAELHAVEQPSQSPGWARPINRSVAFKES